MCKMAESERTEDRQPKGRNLAIFTARRSGRHFERRPNCTLTSPPHFAIRLGNQQQRRVARASMRHWTDLLLSIHIDSDA